MTRPALRFDPGWIAATLLPLVGIVPTLSEGVINTADGPLHVQRIVAMSIMLGEGQWWPRWVPYFHLGFGYPIFNFYPPGVFLLGGILVRLGFTAPVAFTIVAAGAWVLGSLGIYALARQFLPGRAALLAVALWAYAPSRLFEVWDQGSLPQMMAAALIPWLLLGVYRAAKWPSGRGAVGVALPLAGIILTHQPITFITALYVAPLSLMLPWWFGRKARVGMARRLTSVFGGLALGAGLTAIFLLPLAGELRYVQAASGAEDTVDYLISNFLQPDEIFAQPTPPDLTDLRQELPTTLGLVGGVLAALGLAALVWRRQYGLAALLAAGLAFTLYMLLEPSLPVWLSIPLFRQLRFPERFLRVGAVLVALAGGASLWWVLGLIERVQRNANRRQLSWPADAALGVALIVVIGATLPMALPMQTFIRFDNLTAKDEIAFELTNATWGTTSYDEFDPIWGERIPRPRSVPEVDEYATNPTRVIVNRVDMARYGDIMQVEQIDTAAVRVRLSEPHSVRFHQYYFPGWTATLNGEPVEIVPDEEFGLITISAPPGDHVIKLRYTGTPIQQAGTIISLVSLGAAGVLLIRGRGVQALPAYRVEPWTAAAVGGGAIAAALLSALVVIPDTLWFRQQSPVDAPAYMQTAVHADFGGTFELIGYTLPTTETAPGDIFDVMLFWRALKPIDREYRPVVQLVNLTTTEAWAASEPFFPGGGRTVGYPQDRFASEVHELRVRRETPPYVGRVLVQMLDAGTGEPLRLPDGSDRLLLDPFIRVAGNGTVILDELGVRFGETVALYCASAEALGDGVHVQLVWHVLETPQQDVQTFVHGLDERGEITGQGDGQPLGGNYPPTLWRQGQTLTDHYTISHAAEAIETVALGLYTPGDNMRLTATQDGELLPDNRVLIPIGGEPCRQ